MDPIDLVDGCSMPVCVLTRVPQCRWFPEAADFGYCAAKRQYYNGFYGHLMTTFDGVITDWTVTPSVGDEREALWDLTKGIQGLVIGDKGYISAFLQAELATVGIDRQTPWRANRTDPCPPASSGSSREPATASKRSLVNWPSHFILRKSGRAMVGIERVGWHEKSWRTPGVFS